MMEAWLWWLMLALWVRLALVAAHRIHRLQEAYVYNCQVMFYGETSLARTRAFQRIGGHVQMMLDVTRWTYRSFYPEELDAYWAIRHKQLREEMKNVRPA